MKMYLLIWVQLVSIFSLMGENKGENTLFLDSVITRTVDSLERKDPGYVEIRQRSFQAGETLTYKVMFGWFAVGKAKMKIQDKYYRINHRDCYKVDIWGKTSGVVDWVATVDDHWGAYIDTSSVVTHLAFRNIKEGRYRLNEIVRFDHVTDMIEAKVIDKKTGNYKEPMYYQAPNNIRDMIGGFLYLRTVDFGSMNSGDTVQVSGFFENQFYHLKIVYIGKEVINTKVGKFNTLKLVPVMPDNTLFDGENSIFVWISDDENKIPVKVEAEMFIGHAGIEVIEVENLRNSPGLEQAIHLEQ